MFHRRRKALWLVPFFATLVLAYHNCTSGFSGAEILSGTPNGAADSTSSGSVNTPEFSLVIRSPASGATVKGLVLLSGNGPGFLNLEVRDASHQVLGRATPNSSGDFSVSIDTSSLSNGIQALSVEAWDSPAGQPFDHSSKADLNLNVQNPGKTDPPPTGGDQTGADSSVPVGGPGGYTKLVMNDSFGSSKPGANITSLNQFNPKTPYGQSGSGWDDHMCSWDCGKANLQMASDHLEIRPTGGKSGFISSHFEFLPTGNQRVYYEIRATTGRGDYGGGQTWPAFWLFAGNEPGSNNAQSEWDIMETYFTQQWGPYDSAAGGYTQHFVATGHPNANSTTDSWNIPTPGIDITITYNVYGCEMWRGSDGNYYFTIYFNGENKGSTKKGLPWISTPPSLFLGWNPGPGQYDPAVMKVDYVRAWIK